MVELFTPNGSVGGGIRQRIAGCWLVVVVLTWVFYPSPFLPKPTQVLVAVHDLWFYQDLALELMASVRLNLEAIALATVVSLLLAYASTLAALRPVVNVIGKLRFLSLVGLSFFFTLMTSSGHALKLSILVFAVTVFFVVGMVDVIAAIPQEQYDLATTLRMSPWQTLWEVVVLGQSDQAFVILRQNAAMSWMFLSTVEAMDRSGGGIGGLLMNSNKHFHLSEVFAIQVLILLLGLGQDALLAWLRITCCPWVQGRERIGA